MPWPTASTEQTKGVIPMVYTKAAAGDQVTVEFSGSHEALVREIGTAMANVAETAGMMICLSSTDGMRRDDAESIIMQQMLDVAWAKLNQRRVARQNNG